ncbi:hypothetical protein [Cryptosporangium phraense]|uniref:Uncharacterized protein n=1 Tax=Cryptosporangium phraense TaxID=2593070 RepID=A0A545ARC0_9ACTN|nr:hypothetical protein [Cryptosporangium phraense]TQS43823.1 hypothetical protein FL583_17515 [Cryptosporangium phraense]
MIVPVGQLHDVYNAERPWPELVPAAVRVGNERLELTEDEYHVWWLAHGVPELLGHGPWTASRMESLAPGFGFPDVGAVIERLLARGLLAPVDESFASRYRLIPLGVGLGNDPDLDVRRYQVGVGGAAVLSLHPLVWLALFSAPGEADLTSTCDALPEGSYDEVLGLVVDALHPMLAAGVVAVDVRRDAGEFVEVAQSTDGGVIYPVGHAGGPVYALDGGLRSYHVRVGRRVHELDEVEYFCWQTAHAHSAVDDDTPFDRRALVEQLHLVADRVGNRKLRKPEPAVDGLLRRGLLVSADPSGGRDFTTGYRLQSLNHGLGFQPGDYYQIGQVSHALATPLQPTPLSGGFDPLFVGLWQWGPMFGTLADADRPLRERSSGAPLLPVLSRLISPNQSAYLDVARVGA